jgi:hypothetical protein
MSVMVVDPVRFIVGYVGQARAGDNEEILRWIRGKFLNNVTTVLTRICEAEQKSVLSVINNREGLAQAFLERAPDLSEIGIRIVELGRIEPNIPDEHMRELREAVKELADAQRAVRKKQIAVAGAAADAQARQFELDQSFAQEQRQVQQLAGGNLQAYAASRMALGAAQGMAEHGVGGGVAGLGAQMAVGLGMGQMMGGAFAAPVAAPGGAPTAPSASPATASEVACLSCQTRQPPGKFCRECGTSLVPEKKFCRGCRLEVGASAKFCANCGSPQSL